jgi:3-dehydroquinate synthase
MIAPVKFGFKALSQFFKTHSYTSVIVLADENTIKHCLPLIKSSIPAFTLIRIKSGEKNKSLQTCEFIWQSLIKGKADRNSILINLGGGVITDIGGFCASSFMRGIDFIHIPTTIIGMADASIGGKTGIDFNGFKNMIGSFSQARLICIDFSLLKTLAQRQKVAASSELFKHALLQGSKEAKIHLSKSFKEFSNKEIENVIKKGVKFKTSLVTLDSKDKNIRAQLNLGHTLGHAYESYFLQSGRTLLHGEAIALGLLAETFIAHTYYQLPYQTFLNMVFWYDLNFIKPQLRQINFNSIESLVLKDKKVNKSEINMVLLEEEGKWKLEPITKTQIREALNFLAGF